MDENVPLLASRLFASLHHDARHLSAGRRGLADETIIREAIAQDRIIVTQDLDVGRLYYFHHRGEVGVLVIRCARLTPAGILRRLKGFLEGTDLKAIGLPRSLVVLEPHRHRVLK